MASNLCDLKFHVGSVPFRLTTESTEQVVSGQYDQTRFRIGSVERVSDASGNESRRFFLGAHHCQIKLHEADLLLTDEIERVAISLLTVLIVLFFLLGSFSVQPFHLSRFRASTASRTPCGKGRHEKFVS